MGGGADPGGIRIAVTGRLLTLEDFAEKIASAAQQAAVHGWKEANKAAQKYIAAANEKIALAGNPNALVPETEVMIDGIENFHRAALAVGIRCACGHAVKVAFQESPWTVDKHQATLSELATKMQAEAAQHPCPLCDFAAVKGGDA